MTQLPQPNKKGGHRPQQRQQHLESQLWRRLEATGELDRLQRQLHARLAERGWHGALVDRAKELIRRKGSPAKVTLDELVAELLPVGKEAVPAEVKGVVVRQLQAVLRDDGD